MLISIKAAQTLLPKVGDVRQEVPTIGQMGGSTCANEWNTRCECTVVAVYPAHLWYRVKFKDSGFYECYKVPRLKTAQFGGRRA